MGMHVNKAGGHGQTVCINRVRGLAVDFSDSNDMAGLDPNVAAIAVGPGAVIDPAVLDQQVITHTLPPSSNFRQNVARQQAEVDGVGAGITHDAAGVVPPPV